METEIRKILKRGIFTLVSILLIIVLNAYLDHRYHSFLFPQTKQQNMSGPVYSEWNEKHSAAETIKPAAPDHIMKRMKEASDKP